MNRTNSTQLRPSSWKNIAVSFVAVLFLILSLVQPQFPAAAATTLTVTPITWNVIGLDSNNVNVGPNQFPVGARVCNTGSTTATNMTATFVWDSSNTYINLQPGTNSTLSIASLAAGACTDFYFNVEVTRNSAAYDTTRSYHIAISADGGATTGSTPTPRELYVEHLISQNRNSTSYIKLDGVTILPGGTLSLQVGNTYQITLQGFTATQGYNQLEDFLNLPNNIFQILSVQTTYSADSSGYVANSSDKLYADGCLWDNSPTSPTYRSCIGSDGKVGGTVTTTYTVKVIGGAGSSFTTSSLIYDFSGSSYHYNGDFSAYTIVGGVSSPLSMTKSFSPISITGGGTSSLSIAISNSNSTGVSGVNLTDPLPTSPAQMSVANPANASITGTGCSGTFNPAPSATSLSLTNLTIPGSGTCIIKVDVTAPSNGTYINTTGHLFIGNADSGVTASANLTVAAQNAGTGFCQNNVTMAQWTVPSTATNPPDKSTPSAGSPTTKNASVATAVVAANVPANSVIVTTNGFNDTYSWSTWGYKNGGQYVQFTIDTSNFSNVVLSLYIYNPGSGNGPTTLVPSYSTNGTNYTSLPGFNVKNTAFTQYTVNFTGLTNTGGLTYFRLTSTDAAADNSNGNLLYDLMTFTGNQVSNCSAALQPTLTKSFTPSTVGLNGTSLLQFVLTNPNTTQLTGVSFSDILPAGVTLASSSSTVCSGTLTTTAPSSISFSGGVIPASSNCTISVTVTGVTAGTFNNTSGFISSTESGTNTTSSGYGTATLNVLLPPVIEKSFSPNPIYAGAISTLTFTITNPNSVQLNGVAFSDTFPTSPGAMLVASPTGASTTGCGSPTYAPSSGNASINFTNGTILAGGTCVVKVNVTASVTGSYANISSTVTSTNGGTGNTASDTLVVQTYHPSINILKQVSTSSTGPWTSTVNVIVGTSIYYRIIIENTGDVSLSPISVTDPNLSLTTCSWPTILPVGTTTVDPTASCVVGPITASGNGTNTATVHGGYNGTTYDSSPSTATYNITSLSLGKQINGQTSFSYVGEVISYTYTIINNGTTPLSLPVTVTDSNAAVTCDPTDSDGDTLLEQNEGLNCYATYTVTAYDLSVGSISNTAYATVGGVSSNMAEATIHENLPDLVVSKTNNTNGYATVGTSFIWSITVANQGPVDATFSNLQVFLSDQLPSGATYSLAVQSGPNTNYSGSFGCNLNGNLYTCKAILGSLTLGATTGSLTMNILVTPTSYGSLVNTATVDPNNSINESNEGNNTGSDSVNVNNSPTAVQVSSFTATRAKNSILVKWTTASETDNLGFNLYRAISIDGARTMLNVNLIPALPGSQSGADYSFMDMQLETGYTYYYWLEDVDIHGVMTLNGPVLVKTVAGKK